MVNFKRVIFKISGESLAGGSSDNIYDHSSVLSLAKQFIKIKKSFPKLEIIVIIGGGNIWRGRNTDHALLNVYNSDYIGMLGTIMNGIYLRDYLINSGLECDIFSPTGLKMVKDYKIDDVLESLSKKKIIICSGGTGSPFFTTDTTAALRACELKCDAIFMAKNSVDGIYDSDPTKNPKAKFFNEISFQECLDLKLSVMDLTAFTLCKQNNIKLLVFNANTEDNFLKLLSGKIKYTLVK